MARKAATPKSGGRGRATSAKGDPVARKASANAGVKPVSGIEARQSAERVDRAKAAKARDLQKPSTAPVTTRVDPQRAARAERLRAALRSPEGQARLASIKTSLQGAADSARNLSAGLKGLSRPGAPAAQPATSGTITSPHLDRPAIVPPPVSTPGASQRPWGSSNALATVGKTYRVANSVLPAASSIAEASKAYRAARAQNKSISEASLEGAQAAAPGAALAASPIISKGAGHVATGAFEVAKVASSGIGLFDYAFLNMMHVKIAGAAALTGVAAKGVEIGAKVAGKLALPAIAGYQAYQGYKEDSWRGAGRGAVMALDPTELATVFGAKSGIGRYLYDKAAGKAGEPNPYKDSWVDKNGVRKVRRDFSVRAD